jgi:phosphohistidine phosphatase
MFLFLVQHAEAKSKEEDPNRDLTAKGRQETQRMANYLGRRNLAISQIFHSGKTRAATTAEILAGSLQPSRGTAGTEGLAPLEDPEVWADRLARLTENVMLVGHLPHLAKLAALLLCGDKEKSLIHFKMAGVLCLRRGEEGSWGVEWMTIPDMLP